MVVKYIVKFNEKAWRECLFRLRYECGSSLPVKVSRTNVPKTIYGDTYLAGGKQPHFKIRIDKNASEEMAYSILAHEWAHCLAWNVGNKNITDHSPEWGVAYARVYCVVWETT